MALSILKFYCGQSKPYRSFILFGESFLVYDGKVRTFSHSYKA